MSFNHNAMSGGIIYLFDFVNTKVHVGCVFSLESPHRGHSNDNTQHTIYNIIKENHPKLSQISAMRFLQGTKERDQNSLVNEPSVFEPLKFYCTSLQMHRQQTYFLNFG